MGLCFYSQKTTCLAVLTCKHVFGGSHLFSGNDPHEASHCLAYNRRVVLHSCRTCPLHSSTARHQTRRICSGCSGGFVQTELYLRGPLVDVRPRGLASPQILDRHSLTWVVLCDLPGACRGAPRRSRAHTELFSTGIRRYLVWILVAVIGYMLLKVVSVISSDIRRRATLFVFYWLPLVVAVMSLLFGKLATTSFFLFALLLMLGAASLVSDRASDWSRAVLLVLLTAWSASLSGGYNTPALMAGPILVLLVSQSIQARSDERLVRYSIPALAVIILFCFGVARTKYIYREQPASQLTYSLEGVMPGANRIYTNANTFAFLTDLNRAIELVRAQDKESAILPDLAAYWVQAKQKNPLPAVWPQAEELSSKVLTTRFTEAMEARRNKTIFIVQKVEAKDLASGFVALPNSNYYEVVRYARTHFTKAQETDYFELYR